MLDLFRMFARYNRIANERLYEQCARLEDSEYRRERKGSFGSIHKLLNHILLGDRIWMSRFAGEGKTTPPLNIILFEALTELLTARASEDKAIEEFFAHADDAFLTRQFRYINNRGIEYTDPAPQAVLHFFNHQTHHRGQVHGMLSHTEVPPPSLDLHRILNP
jgi:uncharacterized damage-inducible protein DinB